MSKFSERLMGAAMVAGAALAVVRLWNFLSEQEETYSLDDFEHLVKNQKTLDRLDAGEITKWIREIRDVNPHELDCILARPTPEIITKYRLKGFPQNMNTEQNMLFLAVEKSTGNPVKLQMISFGTADRKLLEELFGGEDYAVIKG